MPTATLNGVHVLVVEDDPMIGLLVEGILIDAGCLVCGPYISFAMALEAAATEAVDVAVLDVNLGGVLCYPIGDVLQTRGIPFVLISGYGDDAAPPDRRDWPICGKPFSEEALTFALASALLKSRET